MLRRMRAGLRLQILVLLGALLIVAFVPLYMAVAGYTTVAFRQTRERHARALGRAVAAHVMEAREQRSPDELAGLLRDHLRAEGVLAVGLFGTGGGLVASAGARHLLERLDTRTEGTHELAGADGRAVAVVVPSTAGAVVAVLGIEDPSARTAPLLRLLALYTAVVALALLVLSYFALTRLIVRPLDELTRAAERVASGARRFALPVTNVRELGQLGRSVGTMTERLIAEEEALRKKIDEVEAFTVRLKEAQQRLVRSERVASVGRLAAGFAHEIGNPISALMGMQDLLLEGGLDPAEQRDFIERMRRETERIHHILRDLLQFARPKPLSATPEPGDVARAVRDTAALVAPQKDMKEVELTLELEPSLPFVSMPGEQLIQIVLNLVLNAADAASPGGHISVSARALADSVELSVQDDGPGVAEAVRERLFEPFVTTKEVGKGTGLGLAVCRGLVEAVGGTIVLDESSRRGARFVITLPVARALPPE